LPFVYINEHLPQTSQKLHRFVINSSHLFAMVTLTHNISRRFFMTQAPSLDEIREKYNQEIGAKLHQYSAAHAGLYFFGLQEDHVKLDAFIQKFEHSLTEPGRKKVELPLIEPTFNLDKVTESSNPVVLSSIARTQETLVSFQDAIAESKINEDIAAYNAQILGTNKQAVIGEQLDNIKAKYEAQIKPRFDGLAEALKAEFGDDYIAATQFIAYHEKLEAKLANKENPKYLGFPGSDLSGENSLEIQARAPAIYNLAKELNERIEASGINEDIRAYNTNLLRENTKKVTVKFGETIRDLAQTLQREHRFKNTDDVNEFEGLANSFDQSRQAIDDAVAKLKVLQYNYDNTDSYKVNDDKKIGEKIVQALNITQELTKLEELNKQLQELQAPKAEIAEAQAAPQIKSEPTPLELEINEITTKQLKVPAGKFATAIMSVLNSAEQFKENEAYVNLQGDLTKLQAGEFVASDVITHLNALREHAVPVIHSNDPAKEDVSILDKKIVAAATTTQELEEVVKQSGIRELVAKAKAEQTPAETSPAATAEVKAEEQTTEKTNKFAYIGLGAIPLALITASYLGIESANTHTPVPGANKSHEIVLPFEALPQTPSVDSAQQMLDNLVAQQKAEQALQAQPAAKSHVNAVHQENNTIISVDKDTSEITPKTFVFNNTPYLPEGRTEIHIADPANLPEHLVIQTPAYSVNQTGDKTDARLFIASDIINKYDLTANSVDSHEGGKGDHTMNTILHFSPKDPNDKPFDITLVGQGKGVDGEFKIGGQAGKFDRYGVSHIGVIDYSNGDVVKEIDVAKFPTAGRLSIALENLQFHAEKVPEHAPVDFSKQAQNFLQNRFRAISDSQIAQSL